MMRKLKVLLAMLCVVTLVMPAFAGCTDNRVKIEEITITGRPTNDTLYFLPETTFNLDFTYSPDDLDIPNIIWESSNTSVATISTAAGIKVRQKGIGDTTITATVEGTTVSDSFVLHIIESPVTNIKLDGEAIQVGFSVEGSNVDPAMATVSADKNELTLNTGSAHSSGLGIILNMPAEKLLKKNQVYEVKLTAEVESLSVQGGEMADIEVRTGVQPGTDDWAHFCLWNYSAKITSTGTKNFRGLFTTGNTDITAERWTALLFANPSTTFKVASKLMIKDIELRTITSSDAFIEPQNWKSSYTVNQMNNLHMVRNIGIYEPGTATKVENLDSALKTVYTSSDPTVFRVDTPFDGHITALKAGESTLSAHVVGIPQTGTASGYLTTSKLITVTQPAPDAATKFAISLDGEPTQVTFAAYMDGDASTELSHDGDELTVHTDGESKYYLVVELTLPAGTTLTKDKSYDISLIMDILELTTSDDDVTNVNIVAKTPDTGEPDIAIWKSKLSGDGLGEVDLDGRFTVRGADAGKLSISLEPVYRAVDRRSLAAKFVLKNVVVTEHVTVPGAPTELKITVDDEPADVSFTTAGYDTAPQKTLSVDGEELYINATDINRSWLTVALTLPTAFKNGYTYGVEFDLEIDSLTLTGCTAADIVFAAEIGSANKVWENSLEGAGIGEESYSGTITAAAEDIRNLVIVVSPSIGGSFYKIGFTLKNVVITEVSGPTGPVATEFNVNLNGSTVKAAWDTFGQNVAPETALSTNGNRLTVSEVSTPQIWNGVNIWLPAGSELTEGATYEISFVLAFTNITMGDGGKTVSYTVITGKTYNDYAGHHNQIVWDNTISSATGEVSYYGIYTIGESQYDNANVFTITVEEGDGVSAAFTIKDVVMTEVSGAPEGKATTLNMNLNGSATSVTYGTDRPGGNFPTYLMYEGNGLVLDTGASSYEYCSVGLSLTGGAKLEAEEVYTISFTLDIQKLELLNRVAGNMIFVVRASNIENEDTDRAIWFGKLSGDGLGTVTFEGEFTVGSTDTDTISIEIAPEWRADSARAVSFRIIFSDLVITKV